MPNHCVECDKPLKDNESSVCDSCREESVVLGEDCSDV